MSNSETQKSRLTVSEAAKRLKRHPTLIRLWIRNGKLPAVKEETPRGPVYWLDPDVVDAFGPTIPPPGAPRRKKA